MVVLLRKPLGKSLTIFMRYVCLLHQTRQCNDVCDNLSGVGFRCCLCCTCLCTTHIALLETWGQALGRSIAGLDLHMGSLTFLLERQFVTFWDRKHGLSFQDETHVVDLVSRMKALHEKMNRGFFIGNQMIWCFRSGRG